MMIIRMHFFFWILFCGCMFQEYQQVLDLMRDIILATDLAHHLRIFESLEEMAKSKLVKEMLQSKLSEEMSQRLGCKKKL